MRPRTTPPVPVPDVAATNSTGTPHDASDVELGGVPDVAADAVKLNTIRLARCCSGTASTEEGRECYEEVLRLAVLAAAAETAQRERDVQAYRAESHVRKWVESDAGKAEARAVAAEAERDTLQAAISAAVHLNERAKVDLPEWYADDGEDAAPEFSYFIELDRALAAAGRGEDA